MRFHGDGARLRGECGSSTQSRVASGDAPPRPDASDDSESELGGLFPVAWNRHSKAESADCDDDGLRRELGDGERRSNVRPSRFRPHRRDRYSSCRVAHPVICLPAETETASGDRIAQGLQGRSLLSDKGRFNTAEGSANQNPRRLLEALQRDQSVRQGPLMPQGSEPTHEPHRLQVSEVPDSLSFGSTRGSQRLLTSSTKR